VSYTNNAATGELDGRDEMVTEQTSYAYNAQGNPLSITYPDGSNGRAVSSTTRREYDRDDRPESATPTHVTYNAFGRRYSNRSRTGVDNVTYDAGNMSGPPMLRKNHTSYNTPMS